MLTYKASAPGSLMLLGEYAVLHDYPALVCAINKRITVTLVPREDRRLVLQSILGCHETTIETLAVVQPFAFVLATLNAFKNKLKHGYSITIESEFSDKVGFASSAAVTVATLAALTASLKINYTPLERILLARSIVQSVQGMGSGADVAACTLGGMVAYRMQPLSAERIHDGLPIAVVYSGSKTPTAEAVHHVTQTFAKHLHLFKKLMQAIGECAAEGIAALKRHDYQGLGKIMHIQQGLMHALGVNTPTLQNIVNELDALPSIKGVKISGSGLGDCVVALGAVPMGFVSKYEHFDAQMSEVGAQCEKN